MEKTLDPKVSAILRQVKESLNSGYITEKELRDFVEEEALILSDACCGNA